MVNSCRTSLCPPSLEHLRAHSHLPLLISMETELTDVDCKRCAFSGFVCLGPGSKRGSRAGARWRLERILVTDPKDAVVVGAHVAAVSTTQGISRETVTNRSGLYSLPDLPAGTYDLKIDSPDSLPASSRALPLKRGAHTLDAKLRIAGAGATVQVTASAANVDITQSMIQGQITSQTIESIPLNGRNFLELAYLVPGNRPAPTFDPTKTNTLEVSSAGGFGRGGNLTVDGGDIKDELLGASPARNHAAVGTGTVGFRRLRGPVGVV